MDSLAIVGTVILAHFLALISPGPDFLLLVKSSLSNSAKRVIGMALGIALANGIYIALCIIGVGAIIVKSFYLMVALKILGGLFLLYIAYHAIKAKKSDYQFLVNTQIDNEQNGRSFLKEFMLGLISGLSNPKNIVFYLSLFSVVLTPSVSIKLTIALGLWMTFLVFIWDAMIVFVLARQKVRKIFAKVAYYLDKIAGILLGIMGYKLLRSAFKNEVL